MSVAQSLENFLSDVSEITPPVRRSSIPWWTENIQIQSDLVRDVEENQLQQQLCTPATLKHAEIDRCTPRKTIFRYVFFSRHHARRLRDGENVSTLPINEHFASSTFTLPRGLSSVLCVPPLQWTTRLFTAIVIIVHTPVTIKTDFVQKWRIWFSSNQQQRNDKFPRWPEVATHSIDL